MNKTTQQYHYFYKITNNINGHFYYGVHNTNDLNDGYMGSGKRLNIAYKKYGVENFTKEILKFFNTAKEAFDYESEIVTEKLVENPNCYNLCHGGKTGCVGMVIVKDNNGKMFGVLKNDPRYLSGELTIWCKGKEWGSLKGTFLAKDKNGKIYRITKEDPRYINGQLTGIKKNKVVVVDKEGHNILLSKDDPRYTNGILCGWWKNKKHSQDTINKMKCKHRENGHQQGKKNSQYGTCWIYNESKSIKIKIEDLNEYLSKGWIKGRKMKFNNINNSNNSKKPAPIV